GTLALLLSGGMFNLSAIERNEYLLDYFNPGGSLSFSEYYILRAIGEVNSISVVNPAFVVVSSLLWIIVPSIIGLIRFRRMNLI
ncbi:hypothetical protein HLB03_07240, partial [Acidianus sp. DSM 29099]|nr:hypothetical protein [Acidianus sp. RZ1]